MEPDMTHLCEYLVAAASRQRGSDPSSLPLFRCAGAATTAAAACQRVAALAAGLADTLGLQPGDRVCLAALTTPAHLEALLAVTAAGCIAAPLNWRWAAAEAAHAAALVGARAVVTDAACAPLAAQVAAACPSMTALILLGPRSEHSGGGGPTPGELAGLRVVYAEDLVVKFESSALVPRWAPEGAALAVFTSGTTGRPRAALLTHAALHAQCLAKLRYCAYRRDDVYLHAAPLFHVGGVCSALAMLLAGAAHVFLPAFAAAPALGAVAQFGVTSFIAVPTMAADLVAAAPAGAAYPCVRTVLIGAGGVSPALAAALGALFPRATLLSAYGMTEACSSITFHTLRDPDAGPGSTSALALPVPAMAGAGDGGEGVFVGRAPAGIELAVLRPGGDALCTEGEIAAEGGGEVVTRGPHLMLRYWGDEAATAAALLPGGWFRTGDLGRLHRGGLWLMGRAKDVVKSGGENVAAWEVEACLAAHPAVAAAAVVGLPDPRLGEVVSAAVVLASGWTWLGAQCQSLLPGGCAPERGAGGAAFASGWVDAAALQLHCRQRGLAGFKLPRVVAAFARLPTNATGKVAKAEVRAEMVGQRGHGALPPGPRSRL